MLLVLFITFLAPFCASLPVGSSASLEATAHVVDQASSLPTDAFSNSSSPGLVNRPFSPSIKAFDDIWPYNPPKLPDGSRDPDADTTRPDWYNCDVFAGTYNKVPPRIMCTPAVEEGESPDGQDAVSYTDEEIYISFRNSAIRMIYMEQDPGNRASYQVHWNGGSFPGTYEIRNPTPLVRIGYGMWDPQRRSMNEPFEHRTSRIYQWPLIMGGYYPYPDPSDPSNVNRSPGPDRVLFQLVHGHPIYIGVVTARVARPPTPGAPGPTGERWGFIFNEANMNPDLTVMEGTSYPGLDANQPHYPTSRVLSSRRTTMGYKKAGSTYGPALSSSPAAETSSTGGDGGSGTGTGSGQAGYGKGPGGIGFSGGGASGGQGSFGGHYALPIAQNQFKAWTGLISGPSHIEL
ncbi:uncharacterized protein PG986_013136 [Apiospora aurea]|uniref:Uncharacterized protein n=1 Tax=Apiospora aurea TaxID=335848 RepID=A0ABR1PUQ4_9PEZI